MRRVIIAANVSTFQVWFASLASVFVIPRNTKEILVVFLVSITQTIYSRIIKFVSSLYSHWLQIVFLFVTYNKHCDRRTRNFDENLVTMDTNTML